MASSSTARSTPSRKDTPGAVLLPKLTVLSKENFTENSSRSTPQVHTPALGHVSRASHRGEDTFTTTSYGTSTVRKPTSSSGATGKMEDGSIIVDNEGGPVVPTVKNIQLDIVGTKPDSSRFGASGSNKARHTKVTGYHGHHNGIQEFPIKKPDVPKRAEAVTLSSTWPSVQYQVWVDISNLSLHRLSRDERAYHPSTGRGGRGRNASRSSQRRQRNVTSSDDRIRSSRQSSSRSSNSNNNITTGASLSVESSPGEWRIKSSQVTINSKKQPHSTTTTTTTATTRDIEKPSSIGNNLENYGSDDTTTLLYHLPRLPSRMGENSLDQFFSSFSGGGGGGSGVGWGSNIHMRGMAQVNPIIMATKNLKRRSENTETTTAVPPFSGDYPGSTRDSNPLLKLKGLVRDPVSYRLREAQEKKSSGVRDGSKGVEKRTLGNKAKFLSFSVPYGSTDISLPPSPIQFDDVYQIKRYIHNS